MPRPRPATNYSGLFPGAHPIPQKATVSNAGIVAGVAPGTATITATADGKKGTATITVLDGGIVSNAGGSLTLQSGAVQILVPADALTTSYNAATYNQTGFRLPILDYGHTGGACSITGGYVYRGSAMPAIQGHYFYSDFCAAFLRSLRVQNGIAVDQKDWGLIIPAGSVTSFGQDAAGELYAMPGNNIYKLVPGN